MNFRIVKHESILSAIIFVILMLLLEHISSSFIINYEITSFMHNYIKRVAS